MEAGIPHWSPDGTQIAFTAHRPGEPQQIYIVSASGGELRQITSGTLDSSDATWSPDGQSLIWAGSWDEIVADKVPLHRIDLKTGTVTEVPDSVSLFSPRWSPDGRWLLATSQDGSRILLYDFAHRNWQTLATDANAQYPNWTPDSRCIYFDARKPEFEVVRDLIKRICLQDRKIEPVLDASSGGPLLFGPSGWWTGLAPDGSILAMRDTSSDEIYALDVKFQ